MKLKINNENVDYSIENEKNLSDFIVSLSKELSKQDALITRIVVDGKEIQVSDDTLSNISIDSVKEVEVSVQKKEEVIYELLFECQRLLNEVKKSIIERGTEQKNEILEVFDWIKDTVQTISRSGYINSSEMMTVLGSIDKISSFVSTIEGKGLETSTLIGVIDNLANYIKAIRERIMSASTPDIESIKNMIEETLKTLPVVSESFQVGKDKEAYDKIEYVITVMEILSNYLKRSIKDFANEKQKEVVRLYENLNSSLLKVLEAFENQDVVLIGDLFEYEISDQLNSFKRIFF